MPVSSQKVADLVNRSSAVVANGIVCCPCSKQYNNGSIATIKEDGTTHSIQILPFGKNCFQLLSESLSSVPFTYTVLTVLPIPQLATLSTMKCTASSYL
jgi:hypothetical protein